MAVKTSKSDAEPVDPQAVAQFGNGSLPGAEVVGVDKIRAGVNVDYDQGTTEERQEKYDPTVSAVLSEQKLAKIIELLEESRRDNPLLGNRVDASADAMAMPADPQSLGDAIKRSQADTDSSGRGSKAPAIT